ncbi:hypothetical protein JXA40_12575 [bacterium]|nr:hypothetical protein [candidate division CSSED10-310 bacterium]
MRSRIGIGIILGSAIISLACSPRSEPLGRGSGNIIRNPGFEQGNALPEGWDKITVTFGTTPEFLWNDIPERRTKVSGVHLEEPGFGGWKQQVTLEPDTQYRLSAYLKTENIWGKGLGVSVFFPKFRWMRPLSIRESPEWIKYDVDLLSAGLTQMDLLCAMGVNGLNSGTAWFDDIELRALQNPAFDGNITRSLLFPSMTIRYDVKRGYLTSLKPLSRYPDAPEFLASYPTLPYLDPAKDCFLGDISLDVRQDRSWLHVTTADPEMRHDVKSDREKLWAEHRHPSAGIPVIRSDFSSAGDSVIWRISLENTGKKDLVIGSLELPMPWNNNYCLFDPHDKASQKLLYTRRVSEHKHIGGNSSYVLACPMDGQPPSLVIHPADPDTGFEFAWHEPDTIRNQRRDKDQWIHGAWPGLTRVCLFSRGIKERSGWGEWLNPQNHLVVPAGQTESFTLRLQWLDNRSDLPEALADSGLLGFRVIPALALPSGYPATVIVYGASHPVTVTGAASWSETPVPSAFRGTAVRIILDQEGPRAVDITDADNRTGRLFMFCLPSLSDLMDQRARFIMGKQRYVKPGDPLSGAILCFNSRTGAVLAETRDMWGSGGYEGGITDAMFLALKNTIRPDCQEISFLEDYIWGWLLGGIQDPADYGVAWTVSMPDRKERGYNYIHVLNLYDAMARGSAIRPELYRKRTEDYLDLWWNTFNAFKRTTVRFQDLGLMGRGNITFMPEFFRRFDLADRAASIEDEIRMWGRYWSEDPPYPFGSELFFDNTGYESVFFYRDYIGEKQLAEQAVRVTKAGRGRAPTWFWNDSDQRWWDAVRTFPNYESFTDFGENCHHYMTGLNGYMLLEAYDRGYGRDEPGPVGYSGIWNSWARVQPDGFAGMCYCPDPTSDNYGLNRFTGDVGLGLWGNLKGARCYVVDDPVLGRIAYGGYLLDTKDDSGNVRMTVEPLSGMDHRVRWIGPDLAADSDGPSIRKLSADRMLHHLELVLVNPFDSSCNALVSIKSLPGPEYRWTAESDTPGRAFCIESTVKPVDRTLILEMPFPANTVQRWMLTAVQPVAGSGSGDRTPTTSSPMMNPR